MKKEVRIGISDEDRKAFEDFLNDMLEIQKKYEKAEVALSFACGKCALDDLKLKVKNPKDPDEYEAYFKDMVDKAAEKIKGLFSDLEDEDEEDDEVSGAIN